MKNKMYLPLTFRKSAASLFAAVLTAGLLISGCGEISNIAPISRLMPQTGGGQESFDQLTDEIFRDTVTSSLIDLHFTVTEPEQMELDNPEDPYGEISYESLLESTASVKETLARLQHINREKLTPESQLDYDILAYWLETEASASGLELYVQPLAPTIGVQAQLPILLAEYAFYREQDIENYFSLLSELEHYFDQLLKLEQDKAAHGLMISDDAIDRVLDSCRPYLEEGEGCVLAGTFRERLDSLDFLTEEQKKTYILHHEDLIASSFIPAYEHLIEGIEQLKGTGKVEGGLCYYPKGKDYYRYMVYSSTATSCKSVDTLRKAIKKRIEDDVTSIAALLQTEPDLLNQLDSFSFALTDPEEILSYLQEAIREEYPEPICMDYSLHYVPKALESVLSPAFYLIPPMDRPGINPIYLNQGSYAATDQLFSTLAHEGYPGHLYQSSYFVSKNPSPFRHVLSFSAYSEGWATYTEYESFHLDPNISPAMAELLALDSSINLGIHAYIDIMVNDQGWKVPEISEYINQYYSDPSNTLSQALYEAMIDNPSNYLEYYAGYLEFSDMRRRAEEALGDAFQLKAFHQFLLDIGPAPFSVIRDRLNDWIKQQSGTAAR